MSTRRLKVWKATGGLRSEELTVSLKVVQDSVATSQEEEDVSVRPNTKTSADSVFADIDATGTTPVEDFSALRVILCGSNFNTLQTQQLSSHVDAIHCIYLEHVAAARLLGGKRFALHLTVSSRAKHYNNSCNRNSTPMW